MATDKARFYLEQSVPELQNLIRKKLFTREEVQAIARKRSDFEHVINARGVTTADYARYAEYEMNLASLTKKRAKRLGVKNAMGYTGQRKVFFVLDRAVRRFPGDVRLWMQYVDFARGQGSVKKTEKVLASMLRLHPTKAELWIYAASHAMEVEADATKARGYMQRGLRFCDRQKQMWLAYMRLEMIYITKISVRRKILGLDGGTAPKAQIIEDEEDEDVSKLGNITAEDINPQLKDDALDEEALRNLANTPAMTGAIPIAIFDASMRQFDHDVDLAEQFFDLVAEYAQASCCRRILEHILSDVKRSNPQSIAAYLSAVRLETFGLAVESPNFPSKLGSALRMVNDAAKALPLNTPIISRRAVAWLLPVGASEELDPDLRQVVDTSVRRMLKQMGATRELSEVTLAEMVAQRQTRRTAAEADYLLSIARVVWPESERIRALAGEERQAMPADGSM